MSISNNYNVLVGEYARKHFIKRFEKKYKGVGNHETVWWEQEIINNYYEIKEYFK